MKLQSIALAVFLSFMAMTCTKGTGQACGSYNGKTLYKGPDGGCYYINGNGNKEYVARSVCNC